MKLQHRLVFATLLTLFLFLHLFAQATNTSTLRPTADGSADSASFFQNSTSANACNTVNCYTSVAQTSGTTCASTIVASGTTTYVYSATNAAKQSFTVNISSIPTGNVIQSVDVHTCDVRGASSNGFKPIAIMDSNEVDCASSLVAGTTAAEHSCVLTMNRVKGSSSTFEIGLLLTAAKGITFYNIAAVITYQAPNGRRGQVIVTAWVR